MARENSALTLVGFEIGIAGGSVGIQSPAEWRLGNTEFWDNSNATMFF